MEAKFRPERRIGPLFETERFVETKDPCIVWDGSAWRLFGTGVPRDGSGLKVLRARSDALDGPWREEEPAHLVGPAGLHMAAPGVVFDQATGRFHMAVQEDFTAVGGGIRHFVSDDGLRFAAEGTILSALPDKGEAGLYDPHFSEIGGEKYLVYAGMAGDMRRRQPFIPEPDIFIAKSAAGSWSGEWQRLGKILDHGDIEWHHNPREHPDYEWGIEGPQLIPLPGGKILLNATCFLSNGRRGTRQRVFFALADDPRGPYRSLGPVLPPEAEAWDSGENGHATAVLDGDSLCLFYQGRSLENPSWKYGLARFRLSDIENQPS